MSLPLNENAEVRAATCSSLISLSELSSSSVSPSEKYSCSLSPLIFTNGSTAIECGGGANAGDATGAAGAAPEATGAAVSPIAGLFEIQTLPASSTASTPTTRVSPAASSFRLRRDCGCASSPT